MDQRIYYGDLTPADVAEALLSHFNRGNLRTQTVGKNDNLTVQIATRPGASTGGQTAVSVQIRKVEDGVLVAIGQQSMLGVAASVGQTVMATLHNPWNLLGRLDDLAQDIENFQMSEAVWQVVEQVAKSRRATTQVAERLRRMVCEYCNTANKMGAGSCEACGAPLGSVQPRTCLHCGFVVLRGERTCPSCNRPLPI